MPDQRSQLHTSRLILRQWRDDDLELFARINADSRVMEFMPSTLSRVQSDELAARIRNHFTEHGFGLWAVEVPDVAPFIGFVGLSVPGFQAAFTPCVEIGWRIAFEHWNNGYATEAAQAALRMGFGKFDLPEIVSFTVPANLASRRVMEKIGMVRNAHEDFDHPKLPKGHRLCRHVLYRLRRKVVV